MGLLDYSGIAGARHKMYEYGPVEIDLTPEVGLYPATQKTKNPKDEEVVATDETTQVSDSEKREK